MNQKLKGTEISGGSFEVREKVSVQRGQDPMLNRSEAQIVQTNSTYLYTQFHSTIQPKEHFFNWFIVVPKTASIINILYGRNKRDNAF